MPRRLGKLDCALSTSIAAALSSSAAPGKEGAAASESRAAELLGRGNAWAPALRHLPPLLVVIFVVSIDNSFVAIVIVIVFLVSA